MVRGCALLEEALAKGGRVIFEPPGHPRLLVPLGMGAKLREDVKTVREVLRRAVLFREQAQRPGPLPLLVLPGYRGQGGCLSCGTGIDLGYFRCAICALAVALALET